MSVHESYESQAQLVRQHLSANGFRRDNRCKKWETYKKTVDGTIHRVKFGRMTFTFDWFNTAVGARGLWRNIRSMSYGMVRSDNLAFIAPVQMSDEETEVNEYLDRLGIA
jgi:hypothetical protein